MTEQELVRLLAGCFPRSPQQRNSLFTSDAEIVMIGDQAWGMTVDEFSPEEDLFTSENPGRLGANLVVATLSDLLACGADPHFFLSALCLPRAADESLARGLSEGMASALSAAGCHLCGGDVGSAEPWRFCGFAMGPIASTRPLTRVLAPEPQRLWVTGCLGDANLAALTGAPTPAFELRLAEARVLRRWGTACIDTSGGLLDAAWQISAVSPGMRLEIDVAAIPLHAGLLELGRSHGVPAEAGLLGGAGEYELLFATPADPAGPWVEELGDLGATAIGTASPHGDTGLFLQLVGGIERQVVVAPPCPRRAATVAEHVAEVIATARQLFT